jgi:hypothetical protein
LPKIVACASPQPPAHTVRILHPKDGIRRDPHRPVEVLGSDSGKPYTQSNKEGNVFNFPLGIEKSYRLVASKEGYFPDSTKISTVGLKATKSYEHRFYLKKMPPPPAPEPEYDTISAEEPIALSNIYFDYDDDVILKESEQDLEFVY